MHRSLALLCLAALALGASTAGAQAVDWGRVKAVDYHVVGVYQAATPVVFGERSAIADVSDRVELRFRWDLGNAKPIGAPTFENFPSEVKNLRPDPKGCTAPVLKGAYEHFTAKALVEGLGGDLHLTSERSQPEAQVYAACTGKKTVKAARKEDLRQIPVPSPVMFSMPIPAGPGLAISADRKSFVRKDGDWTWTYTPTVAR